jgi:hypothetical protein
MPGQTYATLQDDLADWAERINDDQLINQIPNIIDRAERKVAREVKILGFTRFVRTTTGDGMGIGNPIYDKPAEWRETQSFVIFIEDIPGSGIYNREKTLFQRTRQYISAYWPVRSKTGEPLYYADYDWNHWLIGPTPARQYPFEVGYYERIQPLSDQNQTNWMTRFAADILHDACMIEAHAYLKNADNANLQMWVGMYEAAKKALTMEDLRQQIDRSQQSAKPATAQQGA